MAAIQSRVAEWNRGPKNNLMCTARPNWLSLSTTFFDKEKMHKVGRYTYRTQPTHT